VNTSARRAAIYARVSSHNQRRHATIESQLAELRERARQDGVRLMEEHIVIDEGHSGSYLDRPGLDRLRDLVHERLIDLVYVHSPDRLARRYAYQAILSEEFDRAGCQLIFLNHAPSQDPEGQLLVQIQGVIAEYERAKITERCATRMRLFPSDFGAYGANFNPHCHGLVTDGVFSADGEFLPLAALMLFRRNYVLSLPTFSCVTSCAQVTRFTLLPHCCPPNGQI
jgi:predicted site-specific integrase-resolvase